MSVEGGGRSNGVAFLVSAEVAFAIIAASCSSPQTAEINADTRARTLMKWVYVGSVLTLGYIGYAAHIDRAHGAEILKGGASAVLIMGALYWYAKRSGLSNPGPATEGQVGWFNGY